MNRAQNSTARPMRRLWCYLVRQEKVQDIFIRLVFGKRVNHQTHQATGTSNADAMSVYSDAAAQDDYTDSITAVSGGAAERMPDPVRIIHKDQDIIGAFCINSVINTFPNWRNFRTDDCSADQPWNFGRFEWKRNTGTGYYSVVGCSV